MNRIRKSVTDVSGLICYRCFRLRRPANGEFRRQTSQLTQSDPGSRSRIPIPDPGSRIPDP
jgi:hypothetical protein